MSDISKFEEVYNNLNENTITNTVYKDGYINEISIEGIKKVVDPEDFNRTLEFKAQKKQQRSALETLSIIAYNPKITRSEIEAIRGVSADNMIRLLLDRNLIKEVGRKDVPGRPIQFGTTKEFLKFFHLIFVVFH